MSELENSFGSDRPSSSGERALERARVVQVFAFLTAGYGAVIKMLVPAVARLLRTDAGQQLTDREHISLLWLLPLLLGVSSSRPRYLRAAKILAGAGLAFVVYSSLQGVLGGTDDFEGFSKLYYNGWVGAAALAFLWLPAKSQEGSAA